MKKLGFGFLLIAVLVAGVQADAQTDADANSNANTSTTSTTVPRLQYETVVQDTSFNSASKVILDQEAIRKSKAPNMSSLLATQANISIVSSVVQPSSIFLRGGDSSHVLILVDGIPFYDPSTIQKTFNINEIDIKSVRKIEIIKGSQSVLYGGQALTGVIKIETLPDDIAAKTNATVEAGLRDYRKISVNRVQPLSDQTALLVRGQATEKKNRSPLKESDVKYQHRLFTGDLGFLYRGDFDSFLKASVIQDTNDLPGIAGAGPIDTEDFVNKSRFSNLTFGVKANNSPLRPRFLFGYQNNLRKYEQPINSFNPTEEVNQHHGGDLINARFEMTPLSLEKTHAVVGLSHTNEKYVERNLGVELSNEQSDASGIFGKIDHKYSENLTLEAGARTDLVQDNDQVETYQLGLSFFEDIKFEYATGFKAPSLFQKYSTTYGSKNPDLRSEKSQTYSLTYQRTLTPRQNYSFTVFETSFRDLIQYQGNPPTGKYLNVARAVSRGVEGQYTVASEAGLRLDVNLGYQEPWDVERAAWLERRPLQSGSLRLTQTWERDQVGYEVQGNGERLERGRSLPSYVLSNFFYNHNFSDQFQGYLRGSNIWNQRYEQTLGYYDEGAFWLAGLEMSY